jgi:pullulanase
VTSVNYLESHDGYTLGDFIRLATGEVAQDGRLSPRQLALNRFAALTLLTSPGPVMLHEGQEFARAKFIAGLGASDPDAGRPDHNSYNKDDATNYLDFGLREVNRDLFDYYRGLIALRKLHPALCRPRDLALLEVRGGDGLLALCTIGASGRFNRYIVVLNASPDRTEAVTLPPGRWTVLADVAAVHPGGDGPDAPAVTAVPPSSGIVFGGRK